LGGTQVQIGNPDGSIGIIHNQTFHVILQARGALPTPA